MAQTRRKRKSKHRGTAAGTIEARGRTGRPSTPAERKQQARVDARARRLNTPPSWKSSVTRAAMAAAIIFLFMYLLNSKIKNRVGVSASLAALSFLIYVPAGYYLELFMYRRRQRRNSVAGGRGTGK
jgi:Flp pilus assembly protein TadB